MITARLWLHNLRGFSIDKNREGIDKPVSLINRIGKFGYVRTCATSHNINLTKFALDFRDRLTYNYIEIMFTHFRRVSNES